MGCASSTTTNVSPTSSDEQLKEKRPSNTTQNGAIAQNNENDKIQRENTFSPVTRITEVNASATNVQPASAEKQTDENDNIDNTKDNDTTTGNDTTDSPSKTFNPSTISYAGSYEARQVEMISSTDTKSKTSKMEEESLKNRFSKDEQLLPTKRRESYNVLDSYSSDMKDLISNSARSNTMPLNFDKSQIKVKFIQSNETNTTKVTESTTPQMDKTNIDDSEKRDETSLTIDAEKNIESSESRTADDGKEKELESHQIESDVSKIEDSKTIETAKEIISDTDTQNRADAKTEGVNIQKEIDNQNLDENQEVKAIESSNRKEDKLAKEKSLSKDGTDNTHNSEPDVIDKSKETAETQNNDNSNEVS